jgi:hypothetical protein
VPPGAVPESGLILPGDQGDEVASGHGATENSEVPFALRPLIAGAGLPGLTLACRGLLQP